MWYFVVFPASKYRFTHHIQPQSAKWLLFKLKKNSEVLSKLRNSEPGGGSGFWGDIFQFQKITDTFLLMSLRTVSRKKET